MKSIAQTLDIVTASQVARTLDVSPSRIIRAINSGEIIPDGRAGHAYIFRRRRVPGLARVLGISVKLTAIETLSPASLAFS